MTWYIKTQLDQGGIASVKGTIEAVKERSEASELSYADAHNFQRYAFEHWSDLSWEIEPVDKSKYVVKAE